MTTMPFKRSVSVPLALLSLLLGFGSAHADGDDSPKTCCPILELRQYTLRPGQRDVLIELFDREFVETQEAEGMKILGQFRDLGNPDRFVWLRGFNDMQERARSLGAFYGGPAWKAHSKAANATMVDVANVLLLRPARPTSGFSLERLHRPAPGSTDVPKRLLIGTIYYFDESPGNDFLDFFEREVSPLLSDAGASILGRFVTESSPNTFPALPVRYSSSFRPSGTRRPMNSTSRSWAVLRDGTMALRKLSPAVSSGRLRP